MDSLNELGYTAAVRIYVTSLSLSSKSPLLVDIYIRVVLAHASITFSPMDTLPPLGRGLPLHHSLQQIQQEPPPPLSSIPGRARQHLVPLKGADVAPSTSDAAAGDRGTGRDSSSESPPPSPPRLGGGSISPVPSRGVPKMGSMDDTYCDRIRSTR